MAEDSRRCERLWEFNNGWTAWQVGGQNGSMFSLPPGIMPTFAEPKLPTQKVVQWHYVDKGGEVYGTDTPNKGRRVEWELRGDRIVGVRLVEDDDE